VYLIRDLWNGIIPAWMKWVAAQDPANGKGPSSKQTVALNRLYSILGTGRSEPAGRRQERRYELMIKG